MPVPAAITDLSTTAASNSPAGSENVFPDLDGYLRAHASFIAQNYTNKANLASPTFTGTVTVAALTATGNVILGDAAADTIAIRPNAVTWTNNPTHSGNHTYSGTVTVTGAATLSSTLAVTGATTLSASLLSSAVSTLDIGSTTNPFASVYGETLHGSSATSASVPRITFRGDTDTGIGRTAADTLALIAGGGTRLTASTTAVAASVDLSSAVSVTGPGGRCAEIYSGTTSTLTDYPVGTVLLVNNDGVTATRNSTVSVYYSADATLYSLASGTLLSGTWRCRGRGDTTEYVLVQRVA